ncbi:MAG: GTP 3',8-cyclase MoaA [Flavobacteriales bacterium]|nr:GTP 3',8-cyclase MoaA [Flavobacteriales bacterium]MBK6944678.1 GTP 3',8-cyclase MoaA [Flavobacteriales bacterium]MBK7241174.1 GTP 3',8-cyclase MoaA [Flavobacteriales bacterium]MBK9534333.1 GTP 3',8-cyclase MoaA [Flavobacteriales bacterium]MBP9137245.1 GTP 3',8-cyclase MoaA [Flavobacteriales bacterium]
MPSRTKPLIDTHDRLHRSLRLSIVDKCDLRCTYCMPEDQVFLKRKELMTLEELGTIARIFVEQFGITKIRITGGEPLVRPDVVEIVRDLSTLPVQLGLTTNAHTLHHHLDGLIAGGLKSINISLDTFHVDRFKQITRRDGFQRVWNNIQAALKKGLRVKVNMVVMRGVNEDELVRFVELTRDHDVHVRFIEFMPFAGNHWGRERVFTYAEMLERIGISYPFEKLNDDPHSTAKSYRVPNWPGTFAVISTVTEPFCGTCDRLRITAEGKMRNCLFSREETDLLKAMRSGADLGPLIEANVLAKHKMLGGLPPFKAASETEVLNHLSARPMVSIGG